MVDSHRLPEDWRKVRLEQVASLQTGLSKSRRKVADPVTVPYVTVVNVQDGYLDLSTVKTIQIERARVDRYLLRQGDVLLTEGGDNDKLGRGTIWRGELPECLHQNHVFVVRPDVQRLDPYYLSALTGSSYGKLYFRRCAKQSTNLATINSQQLKGFPVLLPPLDQQLAIREILTTWDDALALLDRRIELARQRKKGLMQRLLTGRVRFPEFEGEAWVTKPLSELLDRTKGKKLTLIENSNGTPYIGASSFGGDFDRFTKDEEAVTCRAQDILLLWDGENAGLTTTGLAGAVGSTVTRLRPQVLVDSSFLHYHMVLHNAKIRAIRQGSGIPHIPGDFLHWYQLQVPPIAEQRRIAEILKTCDEEIALLERKRELTAQQKKGLMQRLLTGRVRVQV